MRFKLLVTLALCLFLTACGGGGNKSQDTNIPKSAAGVSVSSIGTSVAVSSIAASSAESSSADSMAVTATIFPKVDGVFSEEAVHRISQYASGIGISKVGSPLTINQDGTAIPAVLALNENGDFLLAGFFKNADVQLTSESTAIFLVHLLMGAADSELDFTNRNALIQSSTGLPALVKAIHAAFEKGISLASDTDVLIATGVVVEQISTKEQKLTQVKNQKLSENNRSDGNLPMVLIDDSFLFFFNMDVELSDASSKDLIIKNNQLIYWSASAKDVDENEYSLSVLRPGKENILKKSIPGAFSITLNTSVKSQAYNIVDLSFDVIKLVLGEFTNKYSENVCTDAAVELIVGSDLDIFNSALKSENFSLLGKVDFWVESSDLVRKCGSASLSNASSIFLKQAFQYANGFIKAYKVGEFSVKLNQYKNSLNMEAKTIGVCVDENEKPMSCVETMKFIEEDYLYIFNTENQIQGIITAPGASIPLALETFDVNGNETALPYDAKSEVLALSGGLKFDSDTWTISSTSKSGQMTIRVSDPATEKFKDLLVLTSEVQLTPSVIEVDINQKITLNVIAEIFSSFKLPIATRGTTPKLVFSNDGVVNSTAIWKDDLFSKSVIALKGEKAGETTVYLEISSSAGVYKSNPVTVKVKAPPYWKGSYKITDCIAPNALSITPCFIAEGNNSPLLRELRIREGESNNLMLKEMYTGSEAALIYSAPFSQSTNTFTVPIKSWGVAYTQVGPPVDPWPSAEISLSGDHIVTFTITNRTLTDISGTFSGERNYLRYAGTPGDPLYTSYKQKGLAKFSGTWSATLIRGDSGIDSALSEGGTGCISSGYGYLTLNRNYATPIDGNPNGPLWGQLLGPAFDQTKPSSCRF